MSKIDPAIKKETLNVSLVVLILSCLMEAVFLIIGKWDYTVLLGNLLGSGIGILNFFLMGIGLQKALNKDEKEAKATISFSHTMRYFLVAVVVVLGVVLKCFNTLATVVALFFPIWGIYIRAFINKKNGTEEEETDTES